jgi:WD repeat-containing protein 35
LKLWRLLAEKSLDDLDFVSSEKAFLKCNDYISLQLVKRLQLIDDKDKQKAEILSYYGKYDEAEAVYKRMERKDLMIQLRMKIGDWFKVIQMVKEGSGYDDILLTAYNELG